MNYGFIPSKIDGTEHIFEEEKGFELPEKYSYKKFLPEVINQGRQPICVPCSLSAYINWNKNVETGKNDFDNEVNLKQIFKSRTNKDNDGMSFKDGLKFLKHEGVDTITGNYKINRYAKIGSEIALKQALIMNGPCVGGLPVYDDIALEFWKKKQGDGFMGGHAISIVGYNEKGFIIRNSWGKSYAEKGYALLPYDSFESFTELWTIID
jgi:hypothetical protein